MALKFKNYTFGYDGLSILKPIDRHLPAGTCTVLLGGNGSGKTSFFHSILGLVPRCSGQCEIFSIDHKNPKSREGVAFLSEKILFHKSMKGQDYVDLLKIQSLQIAPYLEHLNFDRKLLNQAIKTYSKGTQQKLALSIFFARQARLFIADEIFSGLDQQTRGCVIDILKERKKMGSTIFFSTHVEYNVLSFCDHHFKLSEQKLTEVLS